jgi:hypothetical protein
LNTPNVKYRKYSSSFVLGDEIDTYIKYGQANTLSLINKNSDYIISTNYFYVKNKSTSTNKIIAVGYSKKTNELKIQFEYDDVNNSSIRSRRIRIGADGLNGYTYQDFE